MLIESYLLEQFEAVARCGTLLKASEELHISQPSLSRSMKKLEEELGVSLFIRENSKISLNETGKLAAGYAGRALEANREMVVLHHCPEDKDLLCQRYLDEQLYIAVAKDHPLAGRESVSFEDLKGLRILMTAHVGFWMDITLKKLDASNLLIQNSMDALGELIDASNLPFFNSDEPPVTEEQYKTAVAEAH